MALSPATAAHLARLRSAVEGVAKAHGLGARVEHRTNSRGELVVALLSAKSQRDAPVHEAVRASLEALAAKLGDGARIATKTSAREGHVIALVIPPRLPGQWGTETVDAASTPYPWAHQCLTCHSVVRVPDYLALLALGWRPESPQREAPSSGWFCGACSSGPSRPLPKRLRRRT